MKQVTLVSLYGEKDRALATLITDCQARVGRSLGPAFCPYDLRQVHATIIGLERQNGSLMANTNFATHRGRAMTMDLDGFLGYLRDGPLLPFQVQVGGFGRHRPYPFASRGAGPFERSFSIQKDKAVLMGWPVCAGSPALDSQPGQAPVPLSYPPTLETLRRAAQAFGILHDYHRTPADVDNDFYFRIGLIRDSIAPGREALTALEIELRRFLADRPPLRLEIRIEDLWVAAYQEHTLALASTEVFPVADPTVTGKFVAGLYG